MEPQKNILTILCLLHLSVSLVMGKPQMMPGCSCQQNPANFSNFWNGFMMPNFMWLNPAMNAQMLSQTVPECPQTAEAMKPNVQSVPHDTNVGDVGMHRRVRRNDLIDSMYTPISDAEEAKTVNQRELKGLESPQGNCPIHSDVEVSPDDNPLLASDYELGEIVQTPSPVVGLYPDFLQQLQQQLLMWKQSQQPETDPQYSLLSDLNTAGDELKAQVTSDGLEDQMLSDGNTQSDSSMRNKKEVPSFTSSTEFSPSTPVPVQASSLQQ